MPPRNRRSHASQASSHRGNDELWQYCGIGPDGYTPQYTCLVCNNHTAVGLYHRASHEQSREHNFSVLREQRRLVDPPNAPRMPILAGMSEDQYTTSILNSGTRALAHSFAHTTPGHDSNNTTEPVQHCDVLEPPPAPFTDPAWNLDTSDLAMAPSRDERELDAALQTARAIEQMLAEDSDDDLECERSDDSDTPPDLSVYEPHNLPEAQGRDRRTEKDFMGTDPHWFPWPDKITCTLDVMMHLPRSVFSEKQMDLFLWLLRVNGARQVHSVRSMKGYCKGTQQLYGVESKVYDGALGHRYYVNDIGQLLAQEMANPHVRPYLHFLPEDSSPRLAEARQAKRWLHELPPDLTTPCVRIGAREFYTLEPALITGEVVCIPVRWFTRKGDIYAQCWDMRVIETASGPCWQAISSPLRIVKGHDFLRPFPDLLQDMEKNPNHYRVPPVSKLTTIYDPETQINTKWDYTDPTLGNRWRQMAKGARVFALPIWLYCDDTSGNQSKKWNAHNSYLFTPAGLPRSEAAQEYNVHFLCTSNTAPPLEMLDGVVDQIETAQKNGIWAWDFVFHEPVLVFPVVLALLGDNPMQSELSCHIGLAGRRFCRACYVEGGKGLRVPGQQDDESDLEDEDDNHSTGSAASGRSRAGSRAGSEAPNSRPASAGSNSSQHSLSAPAQHSSSTQGIEVISKQIHQFLKPNVPRNPQESKDTLHRYFANACQLGNLTRIKTERTRTGVKDTFQEHFLNRLANSYKKCRSNETKQSALQSMRDSLPNDPAAMMSPVWRIKGLNPHSDTPVEILHVVLLGYVKYFWRDAIRNQLKDKQEKKDLLATRLSSIDVSGLGISPLAGKTLVQYAGSLVGRDFRAIAQVAPFVLKDLVSRECYETWKSLSRLVPLVYQPEIPDINYHLRLLEYEIEQFLLRTARWTASWFNKPKFHIIVHLPEHIARFGPAILFATEAFESFNAVIRAKSIHSNRLAPSRDIAQGFAQGNRIRHILSGGLIQRPSAACFSSTNDRAAIKRPMFSYNPNDWCTAGPGPLSLVDLSEKSPIASYIGIKPVSSNSGSCTRKTHFKSPLAFSRTQTSQCFPQLKTPTSQFWPCIDLTTVRGDRCRIGDYVVANTPYGHRILQVLEILQAKGSIVPIPDVILLRYHLTQPGSVYDMPYLVPCNEYFVATKLDDLLCSVNVQHPCSELGCSATGSVAVWQERTQTSQKRPVVEHRNPQNLRVLNTCQMRDAIHLQPFRLPTPQWDLDQTVQQSAEALYAIKCKKSRSNNPLLQAVGLVPIPTAVPPAIPHRLQALRTRH